MTKPKIRSLALKRLSDTDYLSLAQQIAALIPSAKVLHLGETLVSAYKANIAKMTVIIESRQVKECRAIRIEMNEQYEDITSTVNAFNSLYPTKELTNFILRVNKAIDKIYTQ